MRLLSRTLFREIFVSALLGSVLFTVVLFLERAQPLFEFLVRDSGPRREVAYFFALLLPQVLPYTIPLGVLVGTLITLSRKSSDGEITAMRAAGVPGRRVAPPVLAFGFLAMSVAACASLWLTPWAIRERYRVQNLLLAGQLTAEVQPRVFEEQFPNAILYVGDVPPAPGATVLWKHVFLADVAPSPDRGDNPRVTLAPEALATPDVPHNLIQLTLRRPITYAARKDVSKYEVTSDAGPSTDQVLEAQRKTEVAPSHPATEMDTVPLYRFAYRQKGVVEPERLLEARIELHQRLALPLACMLLALVAIPLGTGSRRGGRSSAVVLTVGIAFLYYMGLVSSTRLAQQGTLSPGLAVWIPDIVFGVLGAIMLARLESPGDRDYISRLAHRFRRVERTPREPSLRLLDRVASRQWMTRFPLLPQVVDTYLVASFLFYFALWLATFVLMMHVFTFFELLSDILRHDIGMVKVLTYLFYLTPRDIYTFAPVSVLTAVLVVFGVLSKNNEVTAFKACGVSVYRLTVPIFVASFLLSGSLFAFDHYWVPYADRRQDAIHSEIKGRPAQTFYNPDRKWIYGLHDRIYYYKGFDQKQNMMVGVNVFEIDPETFHLKRHIVAERARWEPALNVWVFQDGWSREFKGNQSPVVDFAGGTHTFPELEETPDYFVKEKVESAQMNFEELAAYIQELQQSGFDTVALQVEFYQKFSVPLFTVILALVSVPFALQAGNRGAMAGVGISIAIFSAYWSVQQLFQQIGNLNQLSPVLAAWSPDVVFSLAGLYFLTRMRT
jgi:lipopolysaccharide export system permease protein